MDKMVLSKVESSEDVDRCCLCSSVLAPSDFRVTYGSPSSFLCENCILESHRRYLVQLEKQSAHCFDSSLKNKANNFLLNPYLLGFVWGIIFYKYIILRFF